VDIRGYISKGDAMRNKINNLLDYIYSSKSTILNNGLDRIYEVISIYINDLSLLKKYIKETNNNTHKNSQSLVTTSDTEMTDDKFNEVIRHIIWKILQKYRNKDLMKNIFDIINDRILKSIDEAVGILNGLKDFIDDYSTKYKNYPNDKLIRYKNEVDYFSILSYTIGNDIYNRVDTDLSRASTLLFDIDANIMDIYFLRRSLDKDYIKNILVYSGSNHTFMYINFLAKYYKFKITHVNYINFPPDSNPEDMYKIILKGDLMDMRELFFPLYQMQCINVAGYPKNFD